MCKRGNIGARCPPPSYGIIKNGIVDLYSQNSKNETNSNIKAKQ